MVVHLKISCTRLHILKCPNELINIVNCLVKWTKNEHIHRVEENEDKDHVIHQPSLGTSDHDLLQDLFLPVVEDKHNCLNEVLSIVGLSFIPCLGSSQLSVGDEVKFSDILLLLLCVVDCLVKLLKRQVEVVP